MPDPFRGLVAAICRPLPGAEVSDPWGGGHEAWKVGTKLFACIGAVEAGVSVKCPDIETAEMLKHAGVAVHAPYFHRSWVRLPETAAADELRHRITASYDLVRAKLPAALRRELAPRDEDARLRRDEDARLRRDEDARLRRDEDARLRRDGIAS